MNAPSSKRPNFFFIGSMKSGTSTLTMHLDAHPEIFMCKPREPTYFVDRTQLKKVWPEIVGAEYLQSEDNYLALFGPAGNEKIRGESSTNYTKLNQLTGVAERLASFAPDAKLLYIMRDPVERSISHYWHHVRRHGESRDPMTALTKDPQFTDPSNYAMQLQPYFEQFPAEHIFTLTFEELLSETGRCLKDMYTWLEIDDTFVPETLTEKRHVTPDRLVQIQGSGLLSKFSRSRFWDIASGFVPRDLRKFARRYAERDIDLGAVDKQQMIDYLRPIHLPQTEVLSRLLDREFKEWKTLYNG